MDEFKFSYSLDVRIGDVNYGNHVGNEAFVLYFQEARIRYLNQFQCSEMDLGDGAGIVLTKVYCEIKSESFYQDRLIVYVQVSEIKKIRFIMNYKIIRESDNKLIATGYSEQTAFDYNKRKPVQVPVSFKNNVERFEG